MIQRLEFTWEAIESQESGEYVRYEDHRTVVRELVEALRDIADDYADRFDINDRSTNPGIKNVIVQARAAIAKHQEEKE